MPVVYKIHLDEVQYYTELFA